MYGPYKNERVRIVKYLVWSNSQRLYARKPAGFSMAVKKKLKAREECH